MRLMRAKPLILKTHACLGVVVHQGVHSNAPKDNESVLTTVSKPVLCLLCMLKAGRRRGHWWCSTPTCSGLNPCRRPDFGGDGSQFSLRPRTDQAAPDFSDRGSV